AKFGTGRSTIRTTQDLMIFSGIPKVVREGDMIQAQFTLRNTTAKALDVSVSGRVAGGIAGLEIAELPIPAGESKEVAWNLDVPSDVTALTYEMTVKAKGGPSDKIKVTQEVAPAVPVHVYQATLSQVDGKYAIEVERPKAALPGRG